MSKTSEGFNPGPSRVQPFSPEDVIPEDIVDEQVTNREPKKKKKKKKKKKVIEPPPEEVAQYNDYGGEYGDYG